MALLSIIHSSFAHKWTPTSYASIQSTVKTLKIGTPRLTTVVVFNIKQFDFTMQ